MITIGEVNIFIDNINYITFLESGKSRKDALIHYYSHDKFKCDTFNKHIKIILALKY